MNLYRCGLFSDMISSNKIYADIPLSTTTGDLKKPTTMLFHTERTKGYDGKHVEGMDKTLKMSSCVFTNRISKP